VFRSLRERITGKPDEARAPDHFGAEAALVRRAQGGDLDALEQLFDAHHRRVYHVAMGLLHNVDDAEDVTQETFARAFAALPRLGDPRAFHAWLTRIAVNLCRDRARRFGTQATLSIDAESEETGQALEIPDAGPRPDQALETADLQRHVREAIQRLPPLYREVVVLHEMDGRKLEEIAAALQVPVGTIKSRLSRGRAQLKHELTPYLQMGDTAS